MTFAHKPLVFALAAAITLIAAQALADDAAGTSSKRADLYSVAAGKTYNIHANDHARMLGKYAAASSEPVPQEVLKDHAAAIRSNVDQARKAFAKLSATAKTNPRLTELLSKISDRLDAVTKKVNQLESEGEAESKLVVSATNDISQDLKATHDASKAIDQALAQQETQTADSDQFENLDSPSYYFTGEGHFID